VNQSPILRFTAGHGTDHRGRTLQKIREWDDARLEGVHDYIQWLFPLPEASAFNAQAPVLTGADIAAFRADPSLRAELLSSFRRLLEFYGYRLQGAAVVETAGHTAQAARWVTPGNHNFLRISRILRSLALLGLGVEAAGFLVALEKLHAGDAGRAIGATTLRHWREAAQSGQA
jgi:Opioid growth factor receptor (OGFr) conserved region